MSFGPRQLKDSLTHSRITVNVDIHNVNYNFYVDQYYNNIIFSTYYNINQYDNLFDTNTSIRYIITD